MTKGMLRIQKGLFTCFLMCLIGQIFSQRDSTLNIGISQNYNKFNLKEGNIPEKWEDGFRTNGEKGTFEWWYFDTRLENSSTVVIIFYTKPFVSLNLPMKPIISVEISKPDGTEIKKRIFGNSNDFKSSKDSCNVNIGKNYFRGNLKEYTIHFEDKDLNITAHLKRTTDSWRPKTGHIVFNEKKNDYFAWVVPVPRGTVKLDYTYKGKTFSSRGSGYHDHNWGTKSLDKMFNHWYWSRSQIGPYNIIASEMITGGDYTQNSIVVFNLSKDGRTIVDDGEKVKMYQTYSKTHPDLDKNISDDLIFIYNSPEDSLRYEYYLNKENTIAEFDIVSSGVSNPLKVGLIKLMSGFDGAYFRMNGISEIRVFKNNKFIENYKSEKTVWELMYLGNPNKY